MPYRILILIILFIFVNPAPSGAGERILLVSGQLDWKPFLMKDVSTGRIYGVMYEILELAALRNNLELKYIDLPWKRAIVSLKKGRIDVICGIFRNKQRIKDLDYSCPVIKNELRIFTNTPMRISKLSDLRGKSGDYLRGGSYGEKVDTFIRTGIANFNEVTDDNTSINRLVRGYSDFFLGTYIDTMLKIKDRGLQDKVKPLPYVLDNVDVFFAFPKGAKKKYTYEKMKVTFEEMLKDGTIDSIVNKHFSRLGISPESVLVKNATAP